MSTARSFFRPIIRNHDLLSRPAPLRPAVFFDLDGTLIEDIPDNIDPSQIRFLPGAGEALARLHQAGLSLVIVTNQPGIARGTFNRAQFARLQDVLLRRLRLEFGVEVLDVAVCPHAPDAQGRPACLCRKPAPGMLIRTARAHGLDLPRSWMVGDTLDDVEAGHRAGAVSLMMDGGGETVWRRSPLREPDAVFSDWPLLADHLLKLAAEDAARAPESELFEPERPRLPASIAGQAPGLAVPVPVQA